VYSGTSEIRTPQDLVKVSLFWRFPYNSCNIMLYNSGPRTLVRIVEVSVIGGVHFRRFHCITEMFGTILFVYKVDYVQFNHYEYRYY